MSAAAADREPAVADRPPIVRIDVPSDAASAAGANQNVSCFDELWAYDSERARRLFDELVPPPTRKIACRLTVTYAGFEGESVLLEELYKRGMKQPEVAPCLRAGDGLLMAWHHEPIAPWQDEKWLVDMRRSLRPNQYLRMIENRFVTTESSFVDLDQWDACGTSRLGSWPKPIHVVSSCGFWPGNGGYGRAAFYVYAYPEPAGYGATSLRTLEAFYDQILGQLILPYDAVSKASNPEAKLLGFLQEPKLLGFLQETYEAAAELGHWDRKALERPAQ